METLNKQHLSLSAFWAAKKTWILSAGFITGLLAIIILAFLLSSAQNN